MKRKTIALFLIVALSLSIATFASATPESNEGSGTIGFKGNGPIVIDPDTKPGDQDNEKPENPTNPENPWEGELDPKNPGITDDGKIIGYSRNLDFGFQEINRVTNVYSSMSQARTQDGRVATLAVYNDTTGSFSITVSISKFIVEGKDTMEGFTLRLQQQGSPATNNTAATFDSVVASDGTIYAASDSSVRVMRVTGSVPGTDARGTFASNYEGFLKVLGDTANAGEAQATLTWTVGNYS